MAAEYRFTCPLPNGLHARPASHLEAVASKFAAAATLTNLRTGTEASAKSVLSLIATDIRCDDPLLLRVEGSDEEAAFTALTTFLRDEFPHCDEALPEVAASSADAALPRALAALGVTRWHGGVPLCRGLAQAPIVRVGGLTLAADFPQPKAGSEAGELARFQDAVAALREQLTTETAAARGTAAEVLKAHAALLRDPALAEQVAARIANENATAGAAVLATVETFSQTLAKSGSTYLRERVLDLQDVAARLLAELYGEAAITRVPVLTGPAIVAAANLTPGQFRALDRRYLRGLVLAHAGATSHTVILARSFGLPTLAGVAVAAELPAGAEVILDGNRGLLLPELTPALRRYYTLEAARIERQRAATAAYRDRTGASADGHELPFLANVSSAEEVAAAVENGAEGVGLFRTEMLFMDRAAAPDEEEQTATYTAAARAAGSRPVIIRTLDIGGDKPVEYLRLPEEANPFLGQRGVRLYADHPALIRTQLRALLRASAHGALKIMVPMIACPEELRAFRVLVDEVRAEMTDVPAVPIGIMIEVPAAVFAIRELARDADFFSLGTNDLAQYFLAADRDNPRVAGLYGWTHPAFLRLLRFAAEEARAAGRSLGLCGEMGEHPDAAPLLLGLGITSISLGAPGILAAKATLARHSAAACHELAEAALAAPDRAAVGELLRQFASAGPARPLVDLEVIALDSAAQSKAEAVKELTDLLVLAGRASDGAAIEEAVWAREEAYSTGFGYGFAVPHCQSPHVTANTLALLRLREPVEWGSLDGAPVRVVILLAIRAADHGKEHLRIFSRLSRLVMREEFRATLEDAPDAATILNALKEALIPAVPALAA